MKLCLPVAGEILNAQVLPGDAQNALLVLCCPFISQLLEETYEVWASAG